MMGRDITKVFFTDSEVIQLMTTVDPTKVKFWQRVFGTNYAGKGYELNSDMIGFLARGLSKIESSDILDEGEFEALKGKIEQLLLMNGL